MLSQVAPFLQIFGAAAGAFRKLQQDINKISQIDGVSEIEGEKPNVQGSIEFRRICFAYPSRPERAVLDEVSFDVPTGKHTAIVGLSGSGKSTIAGLVSRLYEPTSGTILIDGLDSSVINVRHLRSFIGLVQQGSGFLNKSVFENIALGLVSSSRISQEMQRLLLGPELRDLVNGLRDGVSTKSRSLSDTSALLFAELADMVHEAARKADADAFIGKLQHGYGTKIGSGGRLLSGGQKQRVALARALIRDPTILILDEATASLDSQSERRIQEMIERVRGNKTLISIAHRLSTIQSADNIIVIRGGRIVEQGSHAELIFRGGAYSNFVNLQKLGTQETEQSSTPSVTTGDKTAPQESEIDFETQTDSIQHGPIEQGAPSTHRDDEEESEGIASDRSAWSICLGTFRLIRRHTLIILASLLGSVVVGGAFSAEAVIFGNTVGHLSPCQPARSIRSSGNFFGLMFFILAIIEFFANIVSWAGFGYVAEWLLYHVRLLLFRSLLSKDMLWHESDHKTPSGLVSLITKDAVAMGNLSGSVIGTIFSIVVNLIAAITLTNIVAWRIALVCLSSVPLLLGAGLMELRVLAQFEDRHENAYAQSVEIAVEAVESIKTVASYSLEHEVMTNYRRALQGPRKETLLVTLHASLWLALTYFIGNLSYALAFWWGSKQIISGSATPTQFLIVVMSLLVSAQLWSQMFALAPELTAARSAIARILNTIDMAIYDDSDTVSASSSSHTTLGLAEKDLEKMAEAKTFPMNEGGMSVVFHSVCFSYPSRPDVSVLQNFSMSIKPGQFCALVGPSGAGKSTVITLMERLYRPSSGEILIDGHDITRSHDVSFRNKIALVPQDSALFEGTIRFNVALGAEPGHEATDEEIEQACRLANIHDTIMTMPQGYETDCGPKGEMLSGGQKQRIAIARALVRKPRLLILDESTSALDAESERLFQEGLEKAAQELKLTVVAIAHKLNTIRKANVILLLEAGRLVDQGTHEELVERSDLYRRNAIQQMLD